MAQGGEQGPHPSGLTAKVWTFIIKGGQPFQFKRRDRLGPGLDHDGRRSVWKMVGTAQEAEAAQALLTGPLVLAKVTVHTEGDDEEVEALRHQGEA